MGLPVPAVEDALGVLTLHKQNVLIGQLDHGRAPTDGISLLRPRLRQKLVQHRRHRLIIIGLEQIGCGGHLVSRHGVGIGGGDEHQRALVIQLPQAAGHLDPQHVVHQVVQKDQVVISPVLHVADQTQASVIGRHLDGPAPLGGIVPHHIHQQLPVQLAVLTNCDPHKNSPLRFSTLAVFRLLLLQDTMTSSFYSFCDYINEIVCFLKHTSFGSVKFIGICFIFIGNIHNGGTCDIVAPSNPYESERGPHV